MFYSAMMQSEAYALECLEAPGILLDLCDTPQVREGWANHLDCQESDLVQSGGQSCKVRIVRKSVKPAKMAASDLSPQLEGEVLSGEGIDYLAIPLIGGLAKREAGMLLDEKKGVDEEVGSLFMLPPRQWGQAVLLGLRSIVKTRATNYRENSSMSKSDKAKKTNLLLENAITTEGYIDTTYMGGEIRDRKFTPLTAADFDKVTIVEETPAEEVATTEGVEFSTISHNGMFTVGGVEHTKTGECESMAFDGEIITTTQWEGCELVTPIEY